jgi:hypothetical protein
MRSIGKIAAALFFAVLGVPLSATAATIGGTYHAPQYDFQDFWVAADGKNFRVVLAGNPFPAIAGDDVARRLLPVMQDAKPWPARGRSGRMAGIGGFDGTDASTRIPCDDLPEGLIRLR